MMAKINNVSFAKIECFVFFFHPEHFTHTIAALQTCPPAYSKENLSLVREKTTDKNSFI